LADREDSIHIRIRIDVDAEDKAFVENLSSEIGRVDEQIATGQTQKKQKRPKIVKEEKEKKKKPEKFGVPTFEEIETRYLKKFIAKLEKEMGKTDSKDPKVILERLEAKKDRLLLKQWKEGPVGTVASFTTEQAANLRRFVTNPAEILVSAFTKKLGKIGGAAAKGGLYAIIALLVYETVLFVIHQFMEPGRFLDRRFKRIARIETMNFYERTLQEEIRHGYQEIRVATMAGLRGGASQVNGNFFEFSSGATGMIQSSPYRNSQDIYQSQNATGSVTDSQGNPRQRSVFFNKR